MAGARVLRWVLLAVSVWTGACSSHARTFSICAEQGPPPWTYFQRDQSGLPTTVLVGYSVELVSAAFHRIGAEITLTSQPWLRCRRSLLAGETDFNFDAYPDDFPASAYVLSRHYNTLTTKVFFDANHPIAAHRAADLKAYRGCGLAGSSYKSFKLEDKELDLDAKDDETLVRKLLAGHCDYFIEDLEVIAADRIGGPDLFSDPRLQSIDIPDAEPGTLHVAAKRGSKAAELMPMIDEALKALIESGEAERIWRKHSGTIPFRP